jgi:hypothetical protein
VIKGKGINTTQLKSIALITMIIDHIGYVLFPEIIILRYIGRLAFPIYAFLIGEGLKHSRNRKKYFLKMAITFIIFELIAFFVDGSLSVCVLYGFLCAIAIVEIYEWAKKDLIKRRPIVALPITLLFMSTMVFTSDYIFFAILLPLIIYFIKNKTLKMFLFAFTLLLCGIVYGNYQILAIFALIPILLYNGKKGKEFLCKGSFYILYPLHYLIIGIFKLIIT